MKSAPWDPAYRLRLAKAKLAADKAAPDALAAIATEPDTTYDLRLHAAAALAGRPHSDLGSGELNLLAGSPAAVTATAADKFYFYAARIQAAQNVADSKMKIDFLSHCIIDFPRRDEARVPLLLAAAAVNSNEYALGIVEPLQTQFLRNDVAEGGSEEEQIINSANEEEDSDDEPNVAPTAAAKLSRAQQAQVAHLIGDTMSRLNRLADAAAYYDSARRVESSPAARKILLRKITEAKAALRIQHLNAARQPLLHEALEQDRVVRPKLLARVVPASKTAAARGGMKQ